MLSPENLRKGQRYQLTNYGETLVFEVVRFINNNLQIKNIETVEISYFHEHTQYGKGKDYELIDLENVSKK